MAKMMERGFVAGVAACAALALVMGGCASPPGEETAGARVAGEAEASGQGVPEVVTQLEEHALAMYNTVAAGDWQRAQADAGWFEEAMPRVNSQVRGEAALKEQLSAAVGDLRAGIREQDRHASMKAANRITRVAGYMRAPLDAEVPASVSLLGYYGRELEIWSAARDQQMLKVSAAGVSGVWNNLKPSVVAEGGQEEAARFDTIAATVGRASTPDEYGQCAEAVKTGAEEIRRVFLR